jgi:hypothetical protein
MIIMSVTITQEYREKDRKKAKERANSLVVLGGAIDISLAPRNEPSSSSTSSLFLFSACVGESVINVCWSSVHGSADEDGAADPACVDAAIEVNLVFSITGFVTLDIPGLSIWGGGRTSARGSNLPPLNVLPPFVYPL